MVGPTVVSRVVSLVESPACLRFTDFRTAVVTSSLVAKAVSHGPKVQYSRFRHFTVSADLPDRFVSPAVDLLAILLSKQMVQSVTSVYASMPDFQKSVVAT